ncbi:hypothetical protein M413DRAFT_449148 [Hebeloma cylindrosporum]|uniref:Uncharacterized protein n=1 Tax=Hebeloma cylindrosporum TaxID=76867 RepID=A0A0C3BWH9_HEBCY|nr:hypothetical protein M413DRAFT_449148 [Hebeloma cylindrosporum h7]
MSLSSQPPLPTDTMPSNAVLHPNHPHPPLRGGGGGNPQNIVDGLMRRLRDQMIPIPSIAVVSAILLKQVEVLKRNISALVHVLKNNNISRAILGRGLIAASLPVVLPSLAVVLVNAVGFTAAGVARGAFLGRYNKMFIQNSNSLHYAIYVTQHLLRRLSKVSFGVQMLVASSPCFRHLGRRLRLHRQCR